jgi:hypothetical protein
MSNLVLCFAHLAAPALAAPVHLRTNTLIIDPSWQTAPTPITFSEIYGGEFYDARLA